MKKLLPILLIVSLAAFYLLSCKKDKGDPPQLPPYESMVIDFSNFTSLKKSVNFAAVKGTESSTWEFAAGVAGVWNSLISSNINIPLAAFEAAVNYKAVYQSENLWQWSYDFNEGSEAYKARLQGKITTNTVTWKMYITYEGTAMFKDFLWIEGTSKSDGSGGQWTFKESPHSDVQLFKDDWTKSGDEVTSVKYTYMKNDTNKDSFINYLLLTAGNFDSSYKIYFSNGLFSDSDIEWNVTTKDGRLKCVDYLQDENWYCWDTNKINKVCD